MKKLMPTMKKITVIDHAATGAQMKRLREASGVTMIVMGERLGFSGPMVSMLESGDRNWNEDLCERFQKALKK